MMNPTVNSAKKKIRTVSPTVEHYNYVNNGVMLALGLFDYMTDVLLPF